MTFGSKQLDDAYDRWVTTPPEEYYDFEDDEELKTKEQLRIKEEQLDNKVSQIHRILDEPKTEVEE